MDRRFGSRCGRLALSLLPAFTQLSLLCDPHFTVRFQFQTCPVIHLSFQVPTFAVMSSEKEFFPLKGRQCRRETWERFSLVVLPRRDFEPLCRINGDGEEAVVGRFAGNQAKRKLAASDAIERTDEQTRIVLLRPF